MLALGSFEVSSASSDGWWDEDRGLMERGIQPQNG